jgi:hypothetical protein
VSAQTLTQFLGDEDPPIAAPQPVTAPVDDPEVGQTAEPLPAFPTLTGSIHELASALDPDLPYQFKVMAIMTRIGLALSGGLHLSGEAKIMTRLYTVLVSKRWRGKTAANEQIGNLLDETLGYVSESSIDSGPALVQAFQEQIEAQGMARGPAKLLMNADEAKDVFEKAKETQQGRNTLFSELLKLYENGRTGNRTVRGGRVVITDAHLGFIGGATPAGYERMWGKTGGGADGLQSRFVPIGTDAGTLPLRRKQTDWTAVNIAVDKIRAQVRDVMAASATVTIQEDAYATFKSWWDAVTAPSHDSEGEDEGHASRLSDIVKKFVMLLAVTNDTLIVDCRLMEMGITFGTHVLAARERYNPDDNTSHVQGFENAILNVVKKYGPTSDRDFLIRVNPKTRAGGFGPYLMAMKNLRAAGALVDCGTNRSGKIRWGTANQRVN